MNKLVLAKILGNSTKLDLNLTFQRMEMFEPILKEFLKSCNKKRIHREKIRKAFNSIIANLVYNYRVDSSKFISVSLCKGFFLKELNNFQIRYDSFIQIFNWLKEKEYIKTYIGFQNPSYSRQTRFIHTDKLLDYFIHEDQINYTKEFNTIKKLILLKNDEKKNIKYKDTTLIIKRKELLEKLNKVLSYSSISYNGKVLPKPFMYRIFNNSSFKLGGRFYGGYFQQFSKTSRRKIFINGNETVELDFNCLHINLLYNKINQTFNDDAYELPTFPADKYRKSIKLITLIIINSESKEHALKSIRYSINTGKIKPLNPDIAISEIIEKHKPIKKFFFNGLGLDLQYQESMICEGIIRMLIDRKHPVPVLPIHDGFICEKKHKMKLLRAMKTNFKKITGNPVIKIKEI